MNGKRMLQNLPFAVSGGVLPGPVGGGQLQKGGAALRGAGPGGGGGAGPCPGAGPLAARPAGPPGGGVRGPGRRLGRCAFADNWKFEGIAARLGLAPGMLVAVLAVAAVLAALPAAVALATWLLQRGGGAGGPLPRRAGKPPGLRDPLAVRGGAAGPAGLLCGGQPLHLAG